MPLKHDSQGGGTEQDGTRSSMYCSSCYQHGVFTQPEMTVSEMQRFVDGVLKDEMGWWKAFRYLAVRQIPTLVRWKR